MKKLLITLLLVFSLILSLTSVVSAADLNMVTDTTGTLTDSQWERLNTRAESIAEQYRCDVAIIMIDEMTDNDGAFEWAQGLYNQYNFGYGSERSGVLLFISLAERDYSLIARGFGNTAFTDYGKDVMLDRHILPLLGDDKYYEAFSAYLDKAEEFLALARDGTPFDRGTDPNREGMSIYLKLAIIIILPLVIALLICSVWESKMKTARIAKTACNYIPPGGFQLTGQLDMFLYRTHTRTKIQSNSSSGGTTVNSGGFSGRSGKF